MRGNRAGSIDLVFRVLKGSRRGFVVCLNLSYASKARRSTAMQPENVVDACACGASSRVDAPPPLSEARAALIRDAFRLEWLTIAWMTVEAVVAIAAGIAAGS